MDLTAIIVAIVGGICSALCAYIAIVPQIKKNKTDVKDIEEAVNNSSAIQEIKAGLVSEMRKTLIDEYIEFQKENFDLSQKEIETWEDDYKKYKNLGGNGMISELNDTLHVSLLEHEMENKKYKKITKLPVVKKEEV